MWAASAKIRADIWDGTGIVRPNGSHEEWTPRACFRDQKVKFQPFEHHHLHFVVLL
jgi:hypothetical protein